MTHKITLADLDWLASSDGPQVAVDILGGPLAAYMLRPEWRESLKLAPPIPPEGSVCCLLVLEKKNFPETVFEYLSESFVLPLQWKEGEGDSTALPAAVREMATKVRQDLRISGWRIDMASPLDYLDLSTWTLEVESIWAPMAAGLYLVDSRARSQPWVFATGQWTPQGMQQITHIKEKMAAIRNLTQHRDDMREIHVFVPLMNYAEAQQCAPDSWQVHYYPQTEKSWDKTMMLHLQKLDLPPLSSAKLEDRLAYTNRRHIAQDPSRMNYFLENVVDDVANNLAKTLQMSYHPQHVNGQRTGISSSLGGVDEKPFVFPQKLALGVSFSYDVAVLLIKTLRPREVLLMYTEESEKHLADLKKHLHGMLDEFSMIPKCFTLETASTFIRECSDWLSDSPDVARAVEITGGNKPMSAALIKAAQLAGADVLYVQHDLVYQRARYGSGEIVRLDWVTASLCLEHKA